MVEENQCSDQILSQIERVIIILEEVAVVSTSEVEELGDSGTVFLCVYMQMFLFIIIFVVAIMNVFLLYIFHVYFISLSFYVVF